MVGARSQVMVTVHPAAPACRATLVTASVTMRQAGISTAEGRAGQRGRGGDDDGQRRVARLPVHL